MKIAGSVLLLAFVVLIAGCGKSDEQKRAEHELNASIMQAHETQMAKMAQMDDLISRVDAAIAKHDSLIAAYPGAATTDASADLTAAREKLVSARAGMESWMEAHQPYDESGKHEENMAKLKKDATELANAGVSADSAIATAGAALDAHEKAAADLTASKAGKGRKK